MSLLGIPQERIAPRVGMEQETVAKHLVRNSELKKSINDQTERGFSINTIAEKLGMSDKQTVTSLPSAPRGAEGLNCPSLNFHTL